MIQDAGEYGRPVSARLALTPALSPQERGNHSPCFRERSGHPWIWSLSMFCHQAGPVFGGLVNIAFKVGIEFLEDVAVEVEIELAVAHLPGVDVHREEFVEANSERAVATELRRVLVRVF